MDVATRLNRGAVGLLLVGCLLAALTLAAACHRSGTRAAGEAARASPRTQRPHDHAVIRVRGFGEIRIELANDQAPQTVANFEKLAESGFYDGTTFHRVIPDFVIQGGDPNSKNRDPRDDGRGGPGYTIPDEFNSIHHVRGVVSMANRGVPHSAGSQFFILVGDAPHLDGHYTAFGRVVSGMDVVDRIAKVKRDVYGRWGPRDRPLENVVIESIRIEHAGAGGAARERSPGQGVAPEGSAAEGGGAPAPSQPQAPSVAPPAADPPSSPTL